MIRLVAVILNLILLGCFLAALLMRGHWDDMTAYQWSSEALFIGCPIVNLVVLWETVKEWYLRYAQKAAEEGNTFRQW